MKRTLFLILAAVIIGCGSALAQQFDFGTALKNGTFDQGVGHWQTYASEHKVYDGKDLNYAESFFTPAFKMADDPQRFINDATLQIDAVEFTRWQGGIYQVVNVPPEAELWFTLQAAAFSTGQDTQGSITVLAGIDPKGGNGCASAVWSDPYSIGHGQQAGLASRRIKVGSEGRATICIQGEAQYALYKNALFVDNVKLEGKGGLALPQPGAPGGLGVMGVIVTQAPPDPALAGLVGTPAAPASPNTPPGGQAGAGDPALSGLTGAQDPASTGGADGWLIVPAVGLLIVVIGWTLKQRRAR